MENTVIVLQPGFFSEQNKFPIEDWIFLSAEIELDPVAGRAEETPTSGSPCRSGRSQIWSIESYPRW